jgi:hypothetical protein
MVNTTENSNEDIRQKQDEQIRAEIMRRSASIYLSVAFGASILFFLAAYLVGGYPPVAKFGGMLWVWLLSMIISMPIVTSRVKRHLQTKQQRVI